MLFPTNYVSHKNINLTISIETFANEKQNSFKSNDPKVYSQLMSV